MLRRVLFLCFFSIGFFAQTQVKSTDFRKKVIEVKSDTIQIDSVSINSQKFEIFNAKNKLISATEYQINFQTARLIINAKKYPKITVAYFKYPTFITKTYAPLNKSIIVKTKTTNGTLYSLTTNKKKKQVQLFDGLKTRGFISRGITTGNNQNAVTNSALDLKISGKISNNISLNANIFDTNIPIQQNGYSQNLTDFDRIFLEMESDSWRVKAGDLSLENTTSFFLPFKKQVSGLEAEVKLDNANISASGAIVRGKFNRFNFVGVEGNQGPYKLFGANNEAVILIIEGSDAVFVNGNKIERGEDKDYTINYNLGEITFNTTFPINNDMRIWVEFQYAERNYTRFITYEEATYTSEKLKIAGYFYSENDVKNQPLQQSLSNEQIEILANAGNNTEEMFAESAFADTFSENKVLYRKVNQNNIEIFEYATDENEELFTVSFSNVGENQGDYQLDRTTTVGNIYVYVGQNQGNFSPVIRLIAPTKAQYFIVQSDYSPNEKTSLNTEVALSNNDANLFSSLDDDQNKALAAKVNWKQIIFDKGWQLSSEISHEYAHKNFRTLQRWEPVEFNRDWNILTNRATKNYLTTSIQLNNKKESFLSYRFNSLSYDNGFTGNRHILTSHFIIHNTLLNFNGSYLTNTSNIEDNYFLRLNGRIIQKFKSSWLGGKIDIEDNSRKNINTNSFANTSHKYQDYEAFFGVGDSTKIYAKIGVNFRNNDSIRNNRFQEINNRKTIYFQSKLIDSKNTSLSIYANYRTTQNNFTKDEKTINSRVFFRKRLWNNFINLNSTYETSSGNVARQDFFYIETEPGLGFYTWIDYNNDGVKDFNEFEVALFQDQANYLRLPKPNLTFIATQRAKFQQNITINPYQWRNKKGVLGFVSKLYNQTFLTAENEQERQGDSFQFNPFSINEDRLVSLNLGIRNNLFFNKDLQKHSITYLYADNQLKQQLLVGNQENTNTIHQVDYTHKFAKFWLVNFSANNALTELKTENLNNRNFKVVSYGLHPKISFLYSKNNRFSAFFEFNSKENQIGSLEKLQQQQYGVEYFFMDKKNNQFSINFNMFFNNFVGNTNSPVAYQMLEGLQSGTNYTWNLVYTKKINSFLNLNLSYFGRKSETSSAIHSGNVQLRAIF